MGAPEGYWIIDVVGPSPVTPPQIIITERAKPFLLAAGWRAPETESEPTWN